MDTEVIKQIVETAEKTYGLLFSQAWAKFERIENYKHDFSTQGFSGIPVEHYNVELIREIEIHKIKLDFVRQFIRMNPSIFREQPEKEVKLEFENSIASRRLTKLKRVV